MGLVIMWFPRTRGDRPYWLLDPVSVGGRGMEVAATIHSFHPGPEQTAQYCRKGRFKK